MTVTSSDDGSGLASTTCTIDGADTTCGDALASLTDGSHTYIATATDAAGNSAEATFTWNVDTTAPTVSISDGPTEGGWDNDDTPTMTFSGTDENSGVASYVCSDDGGDYAACTSPVSYTHLTQPTICSV